MIYLGVNFTFLLEGVPLWFKISIIIVQCKLAKAVPSPGLAKYLRLQSYSFGN
jgi:hypothetical protein